MAGTEAAPEMTTIAKAIVTTVDTKATAVTTATATAIAKTTTEIAATEAAPEITAFNRIQRPSTWQLRR